VTRLLLLRHAESEWNAQGRWQGVADPPLSARGEAQAELAGRLLQGQGISSVVSSDLQRARATAERIGAGLPVTGPIDVYRDLREYDLGAWSGLTRVQIEARWPGAIEEWREGRLATPDGEERDAFMARILGAVNQVAADRPGQTVLVVTHGGVISAASRTLEGPARRFRHLAGIWLDFLPEGPRPGAVVELLDPDSDGVDSGEATELVARETSGVMDTPAR
jgi:broad specificity phosphatase PhoE